MICVKYVIRVIMYVVIVLTILHEFSVVSMVTPSDNYINNQIISRPLAQWTKLNVLQTPEEKQYYVQQWDSSKSLKENQRNLYLKFLDLCCDFSFKTKYTSSNNIIKGKFDSGLKVIFTKKGYIFQPNTDFSKIFVSDHIYRGKCTEVDIDTAVIPDLGPIDFSRSTIDVIKQVIWEIVQDSVGCEVLRVTISKQLASDSHLNKFRFVLVDQHKPLLAYIEAKRANKYVKKFFNFNGYQHIEFKKPKRERFILLSNKWLEQDMYSFAISLVGEHEDIALQDRNYSKDVGLVHQLIYALGINPINKYSGSCLIQARLKERADMAVHIYRNDKLYKVMYGFSFKGWNTLSEALYTSHRYNCIRAIYNSLESPFIWKGKKFSKEEIYEFLDDYFMKYGDYDLYRYFLSKQSTIKYPEFGKGSYKCKDLQMKKRTIDRN